MITFRSLLLSLILCSLILCSVCFGQQGNFPSSGTTTTASVPGTPGLNAVPVTSGLMAEYRILQSETPASLKDYSGNGVNATGVQGTTPTIIANTGGLQCNANGGVIVPASLNTAIDWFVYIGFQANLAPNGGSSTIYAPIAGNGGGGQPTTIAAFMLSDSSGNNYFQHYVAEVTSATGAQGFGGTSVQAFNGNGLIEWAMPGVHDRYFINGIETPYHNATVTSAGINTSGSFQICGAASGSGFGQPSYYLGQVYYIAAYNRVLNPAERAAVSTYITNAMTQRGVPPVQQLTSITTDTVTFMGDSMTRGTGSTPTFQHAFSYDVVLNNIPNVINDGGDALQVTNWAAAGTPAFSQFFQPGATRNAIAMMIGTNDVCAVSTPAATSLANAANMIRNAKATVGQKFILFTIPDCVGGLTSAGVEALDNLYRQYWRQMGADALCDVAADPNIGASGANASLTYFLDGVHYTVQSMYNEHGRIAQMCINRLFGNTDFSMATTYSSAAAAAVATTAGSETGNTITVTMAATPANCQAGNTAVVAGTTPAGYSGNWFIITRSPTQVTYWTNTTSLGVITIQGTLSCPQQQDADQYMTLNFGAGNFTLESCQGYTGQRIYIQNINAVASTLVPFGSEGITGGGATPTTITALTTAILESELVSAAASGCNWRRVQ
jgi:trimeric autotransporter adhesin